MANTEHHALGASGAHRWMRCPGSVRLSAGLTDAPQAFTDEGTVAALLAEDLFQGLPLPAPGSQLTARTDGAEIELTADFLEAVEEYVTTVRSPHFIRTIFGLQVETDLEIVEEYVEHRVDLGRWIPGAFSTLDHGAVWKAKAPGWRKPRHYLVVTDLKFGRGVPVAAENNEQLGIYLGGLLNSLEITYSFADTAGVIVQPRLGQRSWSVRSEADVLRFMTEVANAASRTVPPRARVTPGPVQCRWCLAKGSCKARAEEMRSWETPDHLSSAEVAALLPKLDELSDWISSVRAEALRLALDGVLPGFKAVSGRTNRKWTDPEAAQAALVANGVDPAPFLKTEFLSPAAAEGRLGKKAFSEVLGPFVERAEGKPQVAPESDPRPLHSDVLASQFDILN